MTTQSLELQSSQTSMYDSVNHISLLPSQTTIANNWQSNHSIVTTELDTPPLISQPQKTLEKNVAVGASHKIMPTTASSTLDSTNLIVSDELEKGPSYKNSNNPENANNESKSVDDNFDIKPILNGNNSVEANRNSINPDNVLHKVNINDQS